MSGPVQGFFVETVIIVVPLLFCAAWLAHTGEAYFLRTPFDTLMLMGCGIMTSGALLFFAAGIRRIRYSTAGLMQYISPSLVFLTAVFVFGEHLDVWKLLSFVILVGARHLFLFSDQR